MQVPALSLQEAERRGRGTLLLLFFSSFLLTICMGALPLSLGFFEGQGGLLVTALGLEVFYDLFMPWGLRRYQEARCLHFVTFSCDQRLPLLGTPSARDFFLSTLERVRVWYGFYVTGYVVMPEHVHLLISEPEQVLLSVALQMLKQIVSQKLPHAKRFWQPRYYDFNVWSEEKVVEKLNYIHQNPVKRGLVESAADWEWSSFRHYLTGVEGVVEVESQWTARKREQAGIFVSFSNPSQKPRPVAPKSGATRTGHSRGSKTSSGNS